MAILTPRWPVPILTLAVLSPTALPAAPPNPFAHLFTYALPTTAPKPPPGLNFKIIPPSDVTPASKDAEIVVVIAHRAPTQPDPFEPLPAANSPENNDAAGNQFRTLFPCCKNPYQDGLDGQAGR